jgi:hypothetical protein
MVLPGFGNDEKRPRTFGGSHSFRLDSTGSHEADKKTESFFSGLEIKQLAGLGLSDGNEGGKVLDFTARP